MTESGDGDRFARRGLVLVVDDQAPNRLLLHDLLEIDGHEVIEANDGLAALDAAAQRDPDVILLDVSMPGIDGFEVCRRLRAAPLTAVTPVLLVTARDQRESRLEGVAAGANDYLVKPIDRSEVILRVRNAVRMRAMHRALVQQYDALRRLERMRDDLVAMIAHDLRSPLTGLRGYLELIQEDTRRHPSPMLAEMLTEALRAVDQLNRMISDMLDVSRMESAALPLREGPADLREIAGFAIVALGPPPSFHGIPVVLDVDAAAVTLPCDAALVQRVIVNLISNAIRFSPEGTAVSVNVIADAGGGLVRVRDRGPGIPEREQTRIFDKFAQLGESRPRTSGLGLTFCRMVVERHGGRIGVDSVMGEGSEFWFWLPGRGADDSNGDARRTDAGRD